MTCFRMRLPLLAACVLCMPACDREPPLPPLDTGTATSPAPPPPLTKPEEKPALKPPHGGHMSVMPDRLGYVEWLVDAGRLYFLDPSGGPLKGAEEIVLTHQSATGPQQVALVACDDPAFTGACWTAPRGELREKAPEMLVRFRINGQPVRVVLADSAKVVTIDAPVMPPVESLPSP